MTKKFVEVKVKIRKVMEEEFGKNSIVDDFTDAELDDYIYTYLDYLMK